MTPRQLHPHGLALAAAMAVALAAGAARAQALRGGDFPGSPTASPSLSPDDTSPASLGASPTDADSEAPASPLTSTPPPANNTGANYGKPRPKKPKLYKPNPKTSRPLPPLVPYRTNPGQLRSVLNPAPASGVDAVRPGPTVAVIPSPIRPKRPLVDADPFAPTGVRFGELRYLPFVEASSGYETNPNQVSVGIKPSAMLRTNGGLDVQSDFPTNSLTASLRGGYSEFPSNSNANRPDANGVVNSRIDVTRNDQINLEGRFSLATQTPGSPQLAVPSSVFITSRPLIASEGATLGATHAFNRLTLGLRATIDRTQYGDATQSDGTISRYSQDNYNDIGAVARASYELTPAIIPFTEVGADTRVRDNPVDVSGYYRDSNGGIARAGSTFEFSRLFTGSASAGYADRHYADSRLPNLRGPTIDGSLVYAVTPLTTVTLRANTSLSETPLPGASGAISRLVSLEIAHVFFRNFTVSGIATYQPNEYQGVSVHETFTQFTLKGAYSFTRDVQLIASASRQELASSIQGNSFRDAIFLAGVRLQR